MKINGKYQPGGILGGSNIPAHRNPLPCPQKVCVRKMFHDMGVEMEINEREITLILSGSGGLVKDAHKIYEYIKSLKKTVKVKFKN